MENEKRPLLWNGSWHMSTFFSTIDQFYNKVKSYSHYNIFTGNEEEDKKKIISRVKEHTCIFGSPKQYYDNIPFLPENCDEGYNYNFDYYYYWKNNTKKIR
ncbi:hypothetical protein BCR36DRAFT_64394 [Piromyces finnis]|uniref:Uncharacterized protein n=1 Tax=Piromyces finnis TaxID=1754191 RepID=A0A1Y1V7Z9_9FUNG|nr:hypothetical protein BCR36DRAFT_64394 [Piromyces finnis]|eukprot:ORX49587.1 hypothetical protein BCR36DRAFT_64394 [Piromyces finnis]